MKRMLSALLITAIVLTFGLVPVSAAYSTSVPAVGQVETQRDPLNIRSGAGTGYRIVGEAPKGTYLQIVGESGNFYKVVYTTSGKTGYAAKQYLKIVSTGTGTIATLRDPLVLRGSPSTSGSNLAQIPKGKVVPLLGKSSDGKWLKVVYGNKIGWCAASYISVAGSTTSTAKKTTISFSSISNPGTITQGNGVHISGTITSTNSKLSSVTASIVNTSGKTVMSKSVTPNTYSFKIYNSDLDWALKFGSLAAGTYTLKYGAKTADGTKNSHSSKFTVKSKTITGSNSSGYNVNAALQYASTHWNTDSNQLCAEFVARCLKAGGAISSVPTTVGSLKSVVENTGKGTLYKLAVESNGTIKPSNNAGKLSPGDPIFIYCSSETDGRPWVHTVLFSGTDSNGCAKAYAHNRAYGNQTYWGFAQCNYCGASSRNIVSAYSYHFG